MSQKKVILERFGNAFELYQDLVESLDEASLEHKLPGLPSNTIGHQLWCVVGARESYSRAVQANEWSGFACSLQHPHNKIQVTEALHRSSQLVLEQLVGFDEFSEVQHTLVLKLLEHEAAHHGQLIRYLYGLKLSAPDSWKERYALG